MLRCRTTLRSALLAVLAPIGAPLWASTVLTFDVTRSTQLPVLRALA